MSLRALYEGLLELRPGQLSSPKRSSVSEPYVCPLRKLVGGESSSVEILEGLVELRYGACSVLTCALAEEYDSAPNRIVGLRRVQEEAFRCLKAGMA